MTSLSVVIPAFDEEARISAAIDAAASVPGLVEILVVDDGSRDGTAEVALHRGARVIRLGRNRGKGAAVRKGMLHARGDLRLMMDADLATPVAELPKLAAALARGADVAVASRERPETRLLLRESGARESLGRAFNGLARVATGLRIRDTQCGFKLWTARAAGAVFPRMRVERFAFDVESLWLAGRMGFRVAEVGVEWSHDPRSTVRVGRDGLRMGWDLVRILVRRALDGQIHPR